MILDIITCISFFQLSLITFFNPTRVNVKANRWFALFFLSAGFMMLNLVILQHHAEPAYHQMLQFTELLRLAITPALYFVVLYFTAPGRVFKRSSYLHFAPFFLLLAFTTAVESGWGIKPGIVRQWLPVGLFILLVVQMCCYLAASISILHQHQKSIKLINADVTGLNLLWLKYLLYIVCLMLLILYADIFFSFKWVDNFRPVIFLAGVFYLGYHVIAQKEVYPFETPDLKDIEELITSDEVTTLAPRLSAGVMLEYKTRLLQLMETDKPYLQSDVTLPQLAGMMRISNHDLSYVINAGLNGTFYKFINWYRIEEAKRLLLSEKHTHLNILGIAYDSGFNSKSTFNSTFKKETGFSPTEFVKNAKLGVTDSLVPRL